jgi:hypothetical protein
MDKDYLLLKRAALGRPSGKWNDDDYDVLADGVVVGRIFKVRRLAGRTPWMWTLAFGHHEDRTPTHGYAATRGAAMAAFAKSWRGGGSRCYFYGHGEHRGDAHEPGHCFVCRGRCLDRYLNRRRSCGWLWARLVLQWTTLRPAGRARLPARASLLRGSRTGYSA